MAKRITALLVLTGFFLFQGPATATTVIRFTNEDLCSRATTAFRGRCIEQRTFRDLDFGIVTEFTFQVLEMLKGDADKKTITFTQPGGVLDGKGLFISGAARFKMGEDVIIFIAKPDQSGRPTFTVGLAQGKFTVEHDPTSGEPVISRDLEGLELFDRKTKKLITNPITKRAKKANRLRMRPFIAGIRSIVKKQKGKRP